MRRLSVALVALLAVGVAFSAEPAAAAEPAVAHVIVVGIPGLRWDQVGSSTTPALWRLAGGADLGALSIRATAARTCAADGWVTLGAGNRAQGPARTGPSCPAPPSRPPDPATLAAVRRANARLDFDADIGGLGTALRGAGRCVTTVGPLAPYADPAASRSVPALASVTAEDLAACPVTLVDARTDFDLAAVAQLRPPGAVLLVVGLSEPGRETAHLHVALSVPSRSRPRLLVSASTRRSAFVQLVDVAPTVLSLLGVPEPASMTGQPWGAGGRSAQPTAASRAALVALDRAAVAQARLVPPFFATLVVGQALLYLLAFVAFRRLPRHRDRRLVLDVTRLVALAAAAALAATFLANLVPWWQAAHPLAALLSAVLVADLLLLAVALLGPWRRHLLGPAAAVAGLTALVLTVDLLTGARLQMSSLAGYSPLVAGRFAGIGNVAFGVFGTAAVLIAAVLAGTARSPRTAGLIVVGVGLVTIVVDGAPALGSDFGGVLALVPAFAVLAMLVTGSRVSVLRLALVGAAAVGVVSSFALLDYARPAAERTHLGRFVGQLLHGGAATVIRRKADANLHLLTHSVLTLLVPLAILFVLGVLLRPTGGLRRAFQLAPALRAGVLATLVLGIIGFAVNDSGVAVPAMAGTLLLPVMIAAAVSAVLRDLADAPGGAADAGRRRS